MPTRNFWVEANIDGRQSKLAGGPRSKDGGMEVRLYVRNHGAIEQALYINCIAKDNGVLEIHVGGSTSCQIVRQR